MQPIVAITAGEIVNGDPINEGDWLPIVYGQSRTYPDAITRAGGAPFIVPLIDDMGALRKLYDACQALLLTGGYDVSPELYNAKKISKTINCSPRRDKLEFQLLEWALADDKPVLGICRGMQMLNVVLGGSLHQDIAAELKSTKTHCESIDQKNFTYLAHKLKITPDSQLAKILKTDQIDTNALHHQAVNRLGDGLVATAYAEDGIVEAVELPGKRFVIGVQSHPEALESETEPAWQRLFKALVNSATN